MINTKSLKFQLPLLLFLLVSIPLIITGFSQNYFIKSLYEKEITKELDEANAVVVKQIDHYKQTIEEYRDEILNDTEIISLINLVSKYQSEDIQDANNFDEAKKLLNQRLIKLTKLARITSVSTYDIRADLITHIEAIDDFSVQAIRSKRQGHSIFYFMEEGGNKDGVWKETAEAFHLEQKRPERPSSEIGYKLKSRTISLCGSWPVHKIHFNGQVETIGYLTLNKAFDQSFTEELSKLSGVPVAVITNKSQIGSPALLKNLNGFNPNDDSNHKVNNIKTVHIDLVDGGAASLLLGYDTSFYSKWLASHYQVIFFILALTCLVAIPIGAFWARRIILQPISQLIVGVERVSQGEYDKAQIGETGVKEFNSLATAFNVMQSDIKKREDLLTMAKNQWQQTFDVLSDVIIILDSQLRIVNANQAAQKLFDEEIETFAGKYCFDMFYDGCKEKCLHCPAMKTLKDKSAHLAEIYYPQFDSRTLLVSSAPIVDSNGDLQGVVYAGKDITTKKELREKLAQSQKMEALGTLAGGIAHDFNNILASIFGYTQLLKKSIPEDTKQHNQLDLILGSSLRAKDLVQQILLFSRQEKYQLEPMLIQNLIKETLKLLRSSIPKNITLQQDIADNCSPVMADTTHIHQILLNLCTNSVQAIGDNKGALKITLNEDTFSFPAEKSRKYVHLQVKDNGCGMSKETLKRACDPYFTTKEVGKGTGLGLSIVSSIIEDYSGQIKIESQLGAGTQIDIFIPSHETDKVKKSEDEKKALVDGGHKSVLLIDDDETVLEVTSDILEDLGFDVIQADTPEQAIRIFKEKSAQISLVVTDMMMPRLSGIEVVHKLRDIKTDIPVLFCSGNIEHFESQEMRNLQNKSCIMKPVEILQFSTQISELIDQPFQS